MHELLKDTLSNTVDLELHNIITHEHEQPRQRTVLLMYVNIVLLKSQQRVLVCLLYTSDAADE